MMMLQFHQSSPLKKPAYRGLSLVEILISFGIFSAGIAGLLLASQGMFEGLRVSMARDVESAYANAILSEINPYDPSIETTYDITTKTVKTMPHGEKFFYTRSINSDTATPDVKNINLYLFRSTTATIPYRQFRREVSLPFVGFNLGNTSTYYKDSMGRVWQPMATNFYASSTAGSLQNGINGALVMNNYSSSTCGFTNDRLIFDSSQEANNGTNTLSYRFFVTLGRHYIVRLGLAERETGVTSGQRSMDVDINGNVVDTLDAVGESSAVCKPVSKSYVASPKDLGSGLGAIDITLTQHSGATLLPRLGYVAIERTEL
jgi:hypothetical protein